MTRILSEKQKEENTKRAKLYYQNHKEELKEYGRKRHKELKDVINKKVRERRANDPNKTEKQKRARQLPRQRWHQFKRAALLRQKTFNITYEQFANLIGAACYYCNNELGKKVETGSGLDRLDNNIGYEITNVVSCCTFCNKLKSNLFSDIEMKAIANIIVLLKRKNGGLDITQQIANLSEIIKMPLVNYQWH